MEMRDQELLRAIHEDMMEADMRDLAMIARLSRMLYRKPRKPAAAPKPVDRTKVKAAPQEPGLLQ